MNGRLRDRLEALGDVFWIRPAGLVLGGVLLGEAAILAEQTATNLPGVPAAWLYSGGEAGARALLSTVAASSIGVAGTTFSITVAALSLASGQMGPRLLRNFVRDSGNQIALGIFLGTFVFALVVLRTVRGIDEAAFVPHLGVTGALLLALLCVGTLVWFVHHVATGINVETVIDAVHQELTAAIARLDRGQPAATATACAPRGVPVVLPGQGYLRAIDEAGLADWAEAAGAVVVLRVRPGDYLFPGAAAAELVGGAGGDDAAAAVRGAFSVGARQAERQDLEFSVRHLVEIALRALSPGINDPFTAIAVLDRLGAVLCDIVPRRLPEPGVVRAGRLVVYREVTDYGGLCDAMFHMIRQSAAGSPAVLIRLLETLGRVLAVETCGARRAALLRHAGLAVAAGRIGFADPADLAVLEARFGMVTSGAGGGS